MVSSLEVVVHKTFVYGPKAFDPGSTLVLVGWGGW